MPLYGKNIKKIIAKKRTAIGLSLVHPNFVE